MKPIKYTLVAALLLLLPVMAYGYQVALEASANREQVSKGEAFTYKLSIIEEGEADRAAQPVPPDFTGFNVTGTFSSSSTKVINGKARRVTDQEYRLSSDLPGEHVIPPAKLVLTDPKTGKTEEVSSNPVKVTVLEKGKGVVQGLTEDIKDIKSPKSFMDKVRLFFYFMVAIVVLVFFLILGLAIYMAKRAKRKKSAAGAAGPAAAPVSTISARDEALARIARADSMRADTSAYYSAIAEAVRGYLKAARGIPALEATTTEIMAHVQKTEIPQPVRDRLWSLLGEADLVKFAKHSPSEEEKARFIEKARQLVSEI